VWLEKHQGGEKVRTVKMLPKSCLVDYNREIFAMAKLAEVRS
jgi:hypothetical protein